MPSSITPRHRASAAGNSLRQGQILNDGVRENSVLAWDSNFNADLLGACG